MADPLYISDPDDLATLPLESSDPTNSPPPRKAILALLQPLANPTMLAACRDPSSPVKRNSKGEVVGGPSMPEYLDITALGLAWRKALVGVAPIAHITFDLVLPKKTDDSDADGFQKVYWDASVPSRGGIAVVLQHVINLAVTVATATRMRCKGDVKFEVTWDEKERGHTFGMELLRGMLRNFSESKASEVVLENEVGGAMSGPGQ